MRRPLIALGFGFFSFVVLMSIGETAGLLAAFLSLAVYCFVCQFLLSRHNADALRRDWPVMLALDAPLLLTVLIMVLVEKQDVILAQAPGILLSVGGGTLAGAVVASKTAKYARA